MENPHNSDPATQALTYVTTRNLITSVGVAATRALSKEDVEQLLMVSGVLEDVSNWVLADLLVWGEERVASDHPKEGREFWDARDKVWAEMLRLCKKNISKSAAYHLRATAQAWPYERRRTSSCISFEHHRLLSGYTPDQQEYWMDVAEAGEWSAARLRISLYSDIDPLEPIVVANTAPPLKPLWTEERVQEYLWQWSSDDAYRIKTFVMCVIGEYENERATRSTSHP